MVMALAAGCGDHAARVRLEPVGGDCGRPMGVKQVKVTAYGPGGSHAESVGFGDSIGFSSFPADTEQFAVEVFIGGGVLAAEGKSAPLAFNALPDGSTIYVQMAPPDGFCELAPMSEARSQPLVAPAGNGALVVGGLGPSGPLMTAEYYDPTMAAFQSVEVPQALADQGFAGAALATLPDGRVALTGGPGSVFIVFDPDKRAFVTDPTVIDRRAFHAVGGKCGAYGVSGRCPSGADEFPWTSCQHIEPGLQRRRDRRDRRQGARLRDPGFCPAHSGLLRSAVS